MTRLDDLPYPIFVGTGAAPEIATFVRGQGYSRALVLCDAKVASRGRAIAKAIGKGTTTLAVPLGERRKTLRTVERVLEALAQNRVERGTLLIGVGGGVATDLFGFVAATYMRGVPFVAVGTSLVAMVDAAIGGKTGVDLRAGKNLAGAFRDPVAVFCDVAALETLPPRAMREGLAELVKHAIIEGDETFSELEELAAHPLAKWPWEKVVTDSLRVKAMVVADDRLERGAREVLNLGHTFGHALELASGYRLSHGSAVAIGLRGAGLLALRTGRFSQSEHLRVLSLLALLRLPLLAPAGDPRPVLQAMSVDKKARDGKLRFVLPRKLGDVEYGVVAPLPSVRAVLNRLRVIPGPTEFR
jgi:3-dehydroquinate synthase